MTLTGGQYRVSKRPIQVLVLAVIFSCVFSGIISNLEHQIPAYFKYILILNSVVVISVIPGFLLISIVDLPRKSFTTVTIYSIGCSIVISSLVGVLISFVYPIFGIENIFSKNIILFTWAAMCSILLIIFSTSESAVVFTIEKFSKKVVLLCCLLMIFGVSGSAVISSTNTLLLISIAIISILPIAAFLSDIKEVSVIWLIWASAIILVFQQVFQAVGSPQYMAAVMLDHGRWIPKIGSGRVHEPLIANSVFTPLLVASSEMSVIEVSNYIYPIITSLIPISIYKLSRESLSVKESYLSVCFFMFSFPFYLHYPRGARVALPVFFLTLSVGVILWRSNNWSVKVILILCLSGIITTHYGTAFLILFAFLATILFAVFIRKIKNILEREPNSNYSITEAYRIGIFSPITFLFYFVVTISWYAWTTGGFHLRGLVIRIIFSVTDLIELEFSGTATETAGQSFQSGTITLSKYLYMIFGIMMVIGLVHQLYLYLVKDNSSVSEEYLIISASFFGMFGAATLEGSGSFNIARIMMIIFAVSAPLVVLGSQSIYEFINYSHLLSASGNIPYHTIGTLLAVFLLLNSGVVSAVYTHEPAPSDLVTGEESKYVDDRSIDYSDRNSSLKRAPRKPLQDIFTAAWIYEHKNTPVFGDYYVWEIYSEYYLTELITRTDFSMSDRVVVIYPEPILEANSGSGLIFITSLNEQTGRVLVDSDWDGHASLEKTVEPVSANRIYTTGDTQVLYQ